jgi:hypothetical protein
MSAERSLVLEREEECSLPFPSEIRRKEDEEFPAALFE